jgi:multiple sugar transport system substrate-binding protein
MIFQRRAGLAATATAVLAVAGGAGCGESGSDDDSGSLTFWSPLYTPDGVAAMEQAMAGFTEQTGVEVEVVGMQETQMAETITSAAASGQLPDVIMHALDRTIGWVDQGLLDVDAATGVVDSLGRDTFNQGALGYVETEDGLGAVPTDGWGQMLYYRTDLFDDAGLPPPDTYQRIADAARTLHGDGMNGIVLGSTAGERFTMQSFEHFALANNCQLVDEAGTVTLDSPACVETLAWYEDLLNNYSAGGEQDVESTRATYLAGEAAMISWSPHLLDELAGLFPDIPPTCQQCQDDPMWLAERTGVVPLVAGPSNPNPTQYGQTIYLGVSTSAGDRASDLVSYLVSDGYLDFLSVQSEGRVPMRQGTAENPTEFLDAWPTLAVGTGTDTAPLAELYGDALATMTRSAEEFERWGFTQGHPQINAAVYGDLGLTRVLTDLLNGALTPQAAAGQMQTLAEDLAAQLDN